MPRPVSQLTQARKRLGQYKTSIEHIRARADKEIAEREELCRKIEAEIVMLEALEEKGYKPTYVFGTANISSKVAR